MGEWGTGTRGRGRREEEEGKGEQEERVKVMGKRGEGKGWRPRGGGLRWVRGEREFHMLAILGEKVVHAALIWRVTRSAHLRRPPPFHLGVAVGAGSVRGILTHALASYQKGSCVFGAVFG